LARLARTASRLARGVPPLPDRFSGFESQIRGFLSDRRYEVAVIEHFWCANYYDQVSPNSRHAVLDMHNIESVLMARRAQAAGFPASAVFRRFERASAALERRWLPRFSSILAASERDAELIRASNGVGRVLVYPNALPHIPAPGNAPGHAIAFSGNLEYDPNRDAVLHFHRRIWPALKERWPGLVWRLIGKNPAAVSHLVKSDPRIEVTGPPADPVKALASAQAVIAPLRIGSGTRVKILEAWAAARPIVSTSVGAEGLPARDGVNILLADQPAAFAQAVSGLLESEELRLRIGRAGRESYEREFTWESAWARLDVTGF